MILVETSDDSKIDEKFKEIAPKMLELKPRDVKEFGISKQTLWNVKNNIETDKIEQISKPIKIRLLENVLN